MVCVPSAQDVPCQEASSGSSGTRGTRLSREQPVAEPYPQHPLRAGLMQTDAERAFNDDVEKIAFAIYRRFGLCVALGNEMRRFPLLWSRPTRRTCQVEAHPTSDAGHTLVSAWSYRWCLAESLGLVSLDQSYRGGSVSLDTAPTPDLKGCNAPKAVCRCSWFGPLTPLTRYSPTC